MITNECTMCGQVFAVIMMIGLSPIFINLTSKSHHLSHQRLQIGFDTSLNHICTESTS